MSFPWSSRTPRVGIAVASLAVAAGALAPVASAAGAAVRQVPLVRVAASKSSNWSGYASTAGPFSSVSASWVQPTGTCTSKTTYSSFWVGIDGDGSNSVEQLGSAVDCHAGKPTYYAWSEMYPAFPKNFPDPVKPGDHLRASVTASGSTFVLTISDSTEKWTASVRAKSATAKKASAEVIAEAPSSGTGVLPLTDFGTVAFTGAQANGTAFGSHSAGEIVMVTGGGAVKAQPSALTGGQNFTDTWHHS